MPPGQGQFPSMVQIAPQISGKIQKGHRLAKLSWKKIEIFMLTYVPSILALSSHLDLDLVSGFLSSFLAESGVLCSVFSRFEFCRHFLLGPSPAGKTHHEPMLSHPFSTWYVSPQFQSFQLISHQVYARSLLVLSFKQTKKSGKVQ